MCIRDSGLSFQQMAGSMTSMSEAAYRDMMVGGGRRPEGNRCLLYTSDAADERSSVDLGGRRIIKKKTNHPLPAGRHSSHDATQGSRSPTNPYTQAQMTRRRIL